MSRGSWGVGQWMLMILAAVVLAAYFGVMGPVVDALEDKIDVIEKKIEQRIDKPHAEMRTRLERLTKQTNVEEKFVETETAYVDAAVILALFVFLTPIAIVMAFVLLVGLCAAIAHVLPVPEGMHKVAIAVLLLAIAVVCFAVRDYWVPYAQYYAGWVAKAYLVATAS